jgi:hypothetical protein
LRRSENLRNPGRKAKSKENILDRVDIAIIGAGVVGLSVAAEMCGKGKEMILVERHDSFGRESSSRNSEVVHAGIYYIPGSFKARFCRRGRELLYDICPRFGIPFRKCGKLIIAVDQSQLPVIAELKERAEKNGVPSLRLLSKKEVREFEPGVKAEGALWSPETGIIDSHSLMAHLEKKMVVTWSGFGTLTAPGSISSAGWWSMPPDCGRTRWPEWQELRRTRPDTQFIPAKESISASAPVRNCFPAWSIPLPPTSASAFIL